MEAVKNLGGCGEIAASPALLQVQGALAGLLVSPLLFSSLRMFLHRYE